MIKITLSFFFCFTIATEIYPSTECPPASGTLNRETFDFQNYARQNPAAIVTKLQTRYNALTDKTTSMALSIQDAITDLSSKSALSELVWNKALFLAARDHTKDMITNTFFSHTGSDSSTMSTRINRYGTFSSAGENLAAGYSTAENIIMALIIDDGVPTRGHRNNLYSSSYTNGAVSISEGHATYSVIATFDFGTNMVNLESATCSSTTTTTSSGINVSFSILWLVFISILTF